MKFKPFACALFLGGIVPSLALGHAFAQPYTLPLPFEIYAWGATVALALSFVCVGFFSRSPAAVRLDDMPTEHAHLQASRAVFSISRALSLGTLLLCIATGVFGNQNVYENFCMTFFWIIFVLAVPYVTVVVGDFYAGLNPWLTLVEWIEFASGKRFEGRITFPPWLSYYPALVLFVTFIWIELFPQLQPRGLGFALIGYSTINVVGTWFFGKANWFRHGEFFGVVLHILGRMAPRRSASEFGSGDRLRSAWRLPLVGLLEERVDHLGLVLVILFMLASTAFDGLHGTAPWALFFWREVFPHLVDHFPRSPKMSAQLYEVWQSLSLCLAPIAYLAVYIGFTALAKCLVRTRISTRELLCIFAATLVPIAFVYHFTHYYTLLLSQGFQIVHLISDPFGFGWNVFGTARLWRDPVMINTDTIWHTQVVMIVLGHVASVYLAHIQALRTFANRRAAMLSQLPMLCLMMAFTASGLWILSQPLSGGR